MTLELLPIQNGVPVARAAVPLMDLFALRESALARVHGGAQVVQCFGTPQHDGEVLLHVVLRDDGLWVGSAMLPPEYPSFTAEADPFHLFERELAEQLGVRPEGHPWLKAVRYCPNPLGRPDVFGNDYAEEIPGRYPYYRVEGDGIHEVAVGPVHAGVIEPGHFRFQCYGERVLHLEIQLGYQHRGVEALLPRASAARRALLVETIAGDTTVGHGLCYAQAMEGLSGRAPSPEARILRSVALELERLACHVGDLGALSGDVAFLPPASYCGRMRGDLLNMTLWLCGNRFSRGLVRPGGVGVAIVPEDFVTVRDRLAALAPQLAHVIELLLSTPSVRARFDGCGRVSREDASRLGLVGPAGRASGLPYDIRIDFPTERYAELDVPRCQALEGDVYARARIRGDEVLHSVALLDGVLSEGITTSITEAEELPLAPEAFVVTLNEGWRGEVSHAVLTDAQGRIERYKVKDPSFHNWNGLQMALRNTGISDFPLNNKSFNLSYCGFDL